MTTAGLPQIFTVEDVAEYLGCDRSTVYRLVDADELRSIRVGVGRKRPGIRITEDALRTYLAGGAA